ncbi:hypothetical protein [Streptomyces sp. NPDC048659]|uniref:hypothetical protein n=1 Tax=Streptomyces sp. NPDC048659 TaxID=3155489 RepID=UPI00341EB998
MFIDRLLVMLIHLRHGVTHDEDGDGEAFAGLLDQVHTGSLDLVLAFQTHRISLTEMYEELLLATRGVLTLTGVEYLSCGSNRTAPLTRATEAILDVGRGWEMAGPLADRAKYTSAPQFDSGRTTPQQRGRCFTCLKRKLRNVCRPDRTPALPI